MEFDFDVVKREGGAGGQGRLLLCTKCTLSTSDHSGRFIICVETTICIHSELLKKKFSELFVIK